MLLRNIQVKFRLTQAEQFRLTRLSQETGMSTAGFIRKCCLSDEHVTVINRELLKDIYREMNRIGVNINQYTHLANALHQISEQSTREMLGWQKELCRTINTKLGGIKTGAQVWQSPKY